MPSTNFLFWNVNRKPLAKEVAELVAEHRIDFVVLAECTDVAAIRTAIHQRVARWFFQPMGLSEGITVLTEFSAGFLTPIAESRRISLRRLELPARQEILVAMIHLPSKLWMSSDSQGFECVELARRIVEVEDQLGHQRTVLMGDFNMNPFEPGLVAASGLHAVMSREVAGRKERQLQERTHRYFYNPMWQHLGDARDRTAGSYFYDSSQQVNYYWNVFDQVLIRPDLLSGFDPASLRIVRSLGTRTLVSENGRPDAGTFSDHLPLVFALEF